MIAGPPVMSIFEAIVLGIVQGITEFLPISSSAHLVLVPYLLGWDDPGLRFAVVTNAATLFAAMVYFRADLVAVVTGAARRARSQDRSASRRLIRAVGVASIPVALVGAFGYGWFAGVGRSPALIAWTSIGFGLLLGWSDRLSARDRDLTDIGVRDAAWIGLAQALALIPGTSRSGITMTAGRWLGFSRTVAARFSFLLAIPVGLMALGKDLYDLWAVGGAAQGPLVTSGLLVGFVAAGVSAYAAIGALLRWLERRTMGPFVAYRLLLGIAILVLASSR